MPEYTLYSDDYVEQCFQVWYLNGSPSIKKLVDLVPKTLDGKSPTHATLENWMYERGWYQRRDELDAKAQTQIDNVLVATKVAMLQTQAAYFKDIAKKAYEQLIEEKFDSSASAVAALIRASQEERKVRGISAAIEKLAMMDDDEVMEEIRKLAERAESTEILDMGETSGEDAELE